MRSIEFEAVVGDRRVQAKVVDPHPKSGSWDLVFDHFYQGVLLKRKGAWEAYLTTNSDLISEDILFMVSKIEEVYPE
jgi:hypothetical protein